MKNENGVPYMNTSEGPGQDVPDGRHGDAPWFRRPDPYYFPGYFFPNNAVLMGMPGWGIPSADGLLEHISERMEREPQPEL